MKEQGKQHQPMLISLGLLTDVLISQLCLGLILLLALNMPINYEQMEVFEKFPFIGSTELPEYLFLDCEGNTDCLIMMKLILQHDSWETPSKMQHSFQETSSQSVHGNMKTSSRMHQSFPKTSYWTVMAVRLPQSWQRLYS